MAQDVERRIMVPLRNQTFFSLGKLRKATRLRLAALHERLRRAGRHARHRRESAMGLAESVVGIAGMGSGYMAKPNTPTTTLDPSMSTTPSRIPVQPGQLGSESVDSLAGNGWSTSSE